MFLHITHPVQAGDTELVKGYLRKLRYDNIGSSTAVNDLLNNPKYINDQYDLTSLRPDFSANDNDECDNCGCVVRGFFIPTTSGPHIFYIAANDGAALFLSTNESSANKVQIASEPTWTGRRDYIGEAQGGGRGDPPLNRSPPISLVAGRHYYIEGAVKEGGGGDHLEVAVEGPGDPPVMDGDRPISGDRIGVMVDCTGSSLVSVVINTNDSGEGSLRAAIANACLASVITFAESIRGVINLTSGELLINRNLTINGPGANVLSVSGNHASRIFEVRSGTVSISGLTIRDGAEIESIGFPEQSGAQARGGGIFNQATLTLTGCVISNNAVVAGRGGDSLENGGLSFAGNGGNGSGGGICNIATLTMIDCSLINNSATGGEGGNDTGGNNGTGGQGYGGGLYTLGTAALIRCTVSGNHATAGIGNGGVGGGSGGGIDNELSLALTNCTVANNAADGSPFDFGGGIFDNGTNLIIRSSTLAGNQSDYGGGLYTFGANLGNAILASNSASGSGPDCSGGITSSDYNLIQNTNDCSIAGTTAHNIIGQNPLLGPLQGNGGPNLTIALLPGSSAIDKGKSFGLVTDQRGHGRPWNFASIPNATGGDGSDIGAFEVMPNSPQLYVERSATNVLFSWSTNEAGFRLQSVTNLSTSNNWTSVNGTAVTIGGKLYITNSATGGNKFYRLVFP